jgi:hypothetical protein
LTNRPIAETIDGMNDPYRYGQQPQIQIPTTDDDRNLGVLSVLNYVYAGLIGMAGLFFTLYIVMGAFMVGAGALDGTKGGAAGGAAIGGFFIVFGGIFVLIASIFAALHIVSGRYLAKRKGHTFITVVACLSLLSMPFGTLLGIFTLILISKPHIKATFTS